MNDLIVMIYLAAISANVPPHVALAIAMTESNLNPKAVGTKGDTGLFQIRHELVRETQSELFHPEVNTKAALKIMKNAMRGCGHYNEGWVICYNRGVTGGKRVVDYKADSYYRKVTRRAACLKGLGYRRIASNLTNLKGCY